MNEPKENTESNILKGAMDAIEKLADLIYTHSPKIMSESKEPEVEDIKENTPLHPGKIAIKLLLECGFSDPKDAFNKADVELRYYDLKLLRSQLDEQCDYRVDHVLAYKFSKVIPGTDIRFWMDLQDRYDEYMNI